ncbi:MAG: hypothetical protein OIF34_11605 [Porticoccaceae bacterium]|nr:hypothetical protein [Porticoccaceae bacterium]
MHQKPTSATGQPDAPTVGHPRCSRHHQQEGGEGLSRQQVDGFVAHFARLTLWMQQTLPQQANLVLA